LDQRLCPVDAEPPALLERVEAAWWDWATPEVESLTQLSHHPLILTNHDAERRLALEYIETQSTRPFDGRANPTDRGGFGVRRRLSRLLPDNQQR
jgi:hypothetical protein